MTVRAETEGAADGATIAQADPVPGTPEHVRALVELAQALWVARGLWLSDAYETRSLDALRKDALALLAAEFSGLPN